MRILLTATIFAALLAPPAQAFTAVNGLAVQPRSGGVFEVIATGGDGPRQIWCAAGQFAHQAQRLGLNDRIYIAEPYGPSQSKPGYRAVIFTTQPSAKLANGPTLGTDGDYSVSLRKVGFSLRVAQAEDFCADVFDEISIRWNR